MKRFAFAVLILGLITACTKSNIQYDPMGEISLQPVTEKATKAAHTTSAYGEAAPAFNVWAWWVDEDAGTSMSDFSSAVPYIDSGEFVHRGSGSWGGETPYYWPTQGSLVFAGYSPSVTSGGTFAYDKTGKVFTATKYRQSHYMDQTADLMWFDITGKTYSSNNNKDDLGHDVNGVPVVFRHALSWLQFRFSLKETETPLPQNWRITGVNLTGIETEADFRSTDSPAWKNHGVSMDFQIWTGNHLVSTTPAVLESTAAGAVVIPQKCAEKEAALVISYDLKKYLGTGTDEWLRAQTVTLPLTAGTDGEAWLPGKKYVYTIVFGDNEIRIAPSVTDWVPEPDINIEVQ